MKKKELTIGLFFVVLSLFAIGSAFYFKASELDLQREVTRWEKQFKVAEQDKKDLKADNELLSSIDVENNKNIIEYVGNESEVKKIHNQFVEATFSYDKASQRNKQMIPFIPEEQVKDLGLDKELDGAEVDIFARLAQQTDYIRHIDDNEIEIMSRITIDYNQTQGNKQYVLFTVNYRKNGNNQWKVYNIRFQDDRYNQEIK
ncbi:hypothetical protein BN424_2359 [Carnobacterium maltaromaticum LMA28]|uniref:Uncharacterized protein n=1 Tax=Carnobacterium maltaromaticum LMA28 TaxID=1234679 RepID=K8E5A6_CARML|nr:hypothetical protein [Carnobacterium maltaromaticum]CCO11799.2 hypothetical protein BN424_2359 [Carnobacterium maltaromaticum LMA28]